MFNKLILIVLSLLVCFAHLTNADLNSGIEDADLTLDSITDTARRGHNDQTLERNSPKEHTRELADKLRIDIKKKPDKCKRQAQKGDTLHIHYKGFLAIGEHPFDTSYKAGQPLVFTLGAGQVIKGWDQGLLGICVGEQRKLTIPPHLAYGESGSPPSIPPHSTLVYEVEATNVIPRTKRQDL